MEHSLNHIKHISQQQPNEALQKLVEDYQLSNKQQTFNLDNNLTLPVPDLEQQRTHVRQRSINKRKRASLYQDYNNNLAINDSTSARPKSKSVTAGNVYQSEFFTHCVPVHTKFRRSLLHSFDIETGVRATEEDEATDRSENCESLSNDDELNDDEGSDRLNDSTIGRSWRNGSTQRYIQSPASTLSFTGIRNLVFLTLIITNFRVCLKLLSYISMEKLQDYLTAVYDMHVQDAPLVAFAAVLALSALAAAYAIELFVVGTILPSSKLNRILHIADTAKKIKKKKSITNIKAKPMIELTRTNKYVTVCLGLHFSNVTILVVLTNYVVYNYVHNCLMGSAITLHSVILAFKLISYYLTNKELRDLYVKSLNQKSIASSSTLVDPKVADSSAALSFMPVAYASCQYPKNITLANICQFWALPTLIYQPVYPIARDVNMNHSYIACKVLELFTIVIAVIYLNNHYALPVFEKLLALLVYEDKLSSIIKSIQILELAFRLSTIAIVMWCLLYYSFFHNYLNILAELTAFGDRHFYFNWWNSDSILKYWQRWNKPLTTFLTRHVIHDKPAASSFKTHVWVFLIWAVIAEAIIGISTHNIFGLAFLSIALQIPLIYLTERLNPTGNSHKVSFTGNCLFWCSFFIGHPICFLLYYLSWCAKHNYVNEYNLRK